MVLILSPCTKDSYKIQPVTEGKQPAQTETECVCIYFYNRDLPYYPDSLFVSSDSLGWYVTADTLRVSKHNDFVGAKTDLDYIVERRFGMSFL